VIKKIYSAGVIPYVKKKEDVEYLLLHYHGGYWDFPKGKMEPGESKKDTALRELYEETGIGHVDLKKGFEEVLSYSFHERDKQLVEKTVYFFVGEVSDTSVQLSSEHQGYTWLDYEQTLYRLTYENAKNLLVKANRFIAGD